MYDNNTNVISAITYNFDPKDDVRLFFLAIFPSNMSVNDIIINRINSIMLILLLFIYKSQSPILNNIDNIILRKDNLFALLNRSYMFLY